jgi:antitoxin HicB
MKNSTTKNNVGTLEYYLGLNYPITFYPEEVGGYTVEIKDLPGCMSQGETLEEALEMIQDAKDLWVTVNLELGKTIPLPSTESEYSGKFVVRLPVSLHRRLAVTALREGVSLNMHVVALLSDASSLASLVAEFEALQRSISHLEAQFTRANWDVDSGLGDYGKYAQHQAKQQDQTVLKLKAA